MGNRLLSYFFLIICIIGLIIGELGQLILDNLLNIVFLCMIFGIIIKIKSILNTENND